MISGYHNRILDCKQTKAVGLWSGAGIPACVVGMAGIQTVRKSIGINIRTIRKRAGLTQEGLAERADLHPVYISQIERGTKAVSVEALWKLAKPLRVPMAAFLRGL